MEERFPKEGSKLLSMEQTTPGVLYLTFIPAVDLDHHSLQEVA